MAVLRACLPYTHPECQPIVQPGVREIHLAATVYSLHDLLVDLVAAVVSEAYKVQRGRRRNFEIRIEIYPARELLRQAHMLTYMVL